MGGERRVGGKSDVRSTGPQEFRLREGVDGVGLIRRGLASQRPGRQF